MKKHKINLIIFHPFSRIGGADLSISKLINNLDNNKYKIDFICLNKQKITDYLNKKIDIHIIKSKKTSLSIFKVRKIIKNNLNKGYKKVIFFSNQNFANVLSYFITLNLEKKIKKIIIERNHLSELFYYNSIKDFLYKVLIRNLMKYTYKKFDAIIGNSKELSTDLSKYVQSKTITIYNSVSAQKNNSSKYINFSKKTILNVGRLEKQKDQETLIRAIYLVNKHFDANLIIIGNGSQYYKLKNLIKFLKLEKKIKILTKINNPKIYYKSCDLFVLSSIYEGFPNVITESIMNDTPVISSNCKSGPKELLMNLKGPDIFELKNQIDLSNKIINHFQNPNLLKKKCAKVKKSFKRFHLKKMINNYEKLFSKI